jgi:hypothetical protein
LTPGPQLGNFWMSLIWRLIRKQKNIGILTYLKKNRWHTLEIRGIMLKMHRRIIRINFTLRSAFQSTRKKLILRKKSVIWTKKRKKFRRQNDIYVRFKSFSLEWIGNMIVFGESRNHHNPSNWGRRPKREEHAYSVIIAFKSNGHVRLKPFQL